MTEFWDDGSMFGTRTPALLMQLGSCNLCGDILLKHDVFNGRVKLCDPRHLLVAHRAHFGAAACPPAHFEIIGLSTSVTAEFMATQPTTA